MGKFNWKSYLDNYVRIKDFPDYEINRRGQVRKVEDGKLVKLTNYKGSRTVSGWRYSLRYVDGKGTTVSLVKLLADTFPTEDIGDFPIKVKYILSEWEKNPVNSGRASERLEDKYDLSRWEF